MALDLSDTLVIGISATALFDLSEADAIRFSWRGTRFRVTTDNIVEEVGENVLIGSNEALLLEALLLT